MKIAFLHYHLKTGGVCTVLRHQIRALQDDCRLLVLSGEPPPADFPAEVKVVPGIGYDRKGRKPPDPGALADAVDAAIREVWPGGCDVLHIHNPLLAKNTAFLKMIGHLGARCRLFLQIHDFAEDGRPSVYFRDEYPADCHYGVINSRDYVFLADAGLQTPGLHLLPNMVVPFDGVEDTAAVEAFALYPVRAIRRKNVGEALLLSLFFKDAKQLAITLPPNSPADIQAYEGWKRFAGHHGLNVVFEASAKRSFLSLVRSARFFITTSISEGFGFSFLEPWTANKMLAGRKLTDICRDFEKQGIQLPHFYSRLNIPLEWIDANDFYSRWTQCLLKNGLKYGIRFGADEISSCFEQLTTDHCIDFGILNETMQQRVLHRLVMKPRHMDTLLALNPFLRNRFPEANEGLIAQNRQVVDAAYGIARYRERLLGIYGKVLSSNPVRHYVDKLKLARRFFDPLRFSLLQWESYGN